jgi:hypothetical protein
MSYTRAHGPTRAKTDAAGKRAKRAAGTEPPATGQWNGTPGDRAEGTEPSATGAEGRNPRRPGRRTEPSATAQKDGTTGDRAEGRNPRRPRRRNGTPGDRAEVPRPKPRRGRSPKTETTARQKSEDGNPCERPGTTERPPGLPTLPATPNERISTTSSVATERSEGGSLWLTAARRHPRTHLPTGPADPHAPNGPSSAWCATSPTTLPLLALCGGSPTVLSLVRRGRRSPGGDRRVQAANSGLSAPGAAVPTTQAAHWGLSDRSQR